MGNEMNLEGMSDLLARLQQLGDKAAKVENEALRKGAEPLAKTMSEKVAVSDRNETHIRDDIQIGKVKTKDDVKYIEVGPGKETNWRAKFLEFGTTKMSPRPFMDVSLHESNDDVIDAIKSVIKEEIGL